MNAISEPYTINGKPLADCTRDELEREADAADWMMQAGWRGCYAKLEAVRKELDRRAPDALDHGLATGRLIEEAERLLHTIADHRKKAVRELPIAPLLAAVERMKGLG